jgi:cysteinyl-tRNA synthetase
MIKFYNTLTRKLEEFKPLRPAQGKQKGFIGIYSCGPTVYWNQHLGHMYAYVQWDTLVRFFRFLDYQVKWVMNITDVGHLTSDEDTGEDKMEKGARREGLTVWQIADKYLAQFKDSLRLLNIQTPDVLCRATKHIDTQIDLIKKIEANGFAYKTKTGLVFDTSKFPDYAQFGRLRLDKQTAGARVEIDPEKKQPWDFLLWVTNQPKHIMLWESPWGRGFPGWHIECTAMSTKYLGKQFDIHTGGKEHIPVHHTNEIAQAYGAFGRQTANYWLHNEWLTLKGGEKMSKSKGNFFTAQDLPKKAFSPLAFRYLVLTSHYRQGLVFDWEALKGAQTAWEKLVSMVKDWSGNRRTGRGETVIAPDDPGKIEQFQADFSGRLADDLNAPEAVAVVWQMAKSDLPSPEKLDLLLQFDEVLGLGLLAAAKAKKEIKAPVEVQKLAEKREQLRQAGDWQQADQVRRQIEGMGWKIEDTSGGYQLIAAKSGI